MSQLTNSIAASRPTGVADAPQISFVLRRYVWLIILGTIFCAGAAFGLWYYLYRTAPRYTATDYFQVLPTPTPPGAANYQVAFPTQEEITRFINRQVIFIKSDEVIDRCLRSDEFQHDYRDPTSSRHSQWLEDNTVALAKKRLKEDMTITAKPSSDVFTIDMTAKDRNEASRLVNAIARVYQDSLSNETKVNQGRLMEQSAKQLEEQDQTVLRLQVELADFRRANNIDAITPRYTLQMQVLGEIDKEYTRIQGQVIAAGQQFESIKKQVENNTLQLTPEKEQEVDNDPELRYLTQTRLNLEVDHEVAIQNYGLAAKVVKDLEIRIGVVDRQIAETRQKATAKAKLSMQTSAETQFAGLSASMEFLKKARDTKDLEVKELDGWLVKAQAKMEALDAQKGVLAKLRADVQFLHLQGTTDESRIRRLGGDAIAPEDISWPIGWKFIVPGAAIGLFLAFGMAYLFELTNTRVRTPHDITKTLQMPLLGFIPDQDDDSGATGELTTSVRTSPSSMIAESFRQIRGRLIAEGNGSPVKTLLVASIAPGGGATTVASNIANGMALNQLNVLLIDANFYRPGLKLSYPNIPAIGLGDLIGSLDQVDAAIVPSDQMPNLHVMGTGNVGSNPAEMLESKGFRELLDLLKSRYDMIVFDGAPLSLVSDSVALGARVDGVIAVVRAGEVSRGTVARVREQLRQVRANFMGVVLNAAQTHGAGYFKENYRTFYKYAGQGARTNGAATH